MLNTQLARPMPVAEEELRSAVKEAELPPLLAALAYLTGDISLLSDDLRPPLRPMAAAIEPHGGMTDAAQCRARELIVEKLLWLREHRQAAVSGTSGEALLERVIAFLTGNASREYLPLLEHELALSADHGAPKWSKAEIAPQRDFSVVVIGAGASGLAAAHRLKQAGVPFVVVEKNTDVGGTWWENDYPGCRLDTPNYAYSFSFAQKEDWPEQFSQQREIRDYFRGVSEDLDLRRHVRFSTKVTAAVYRESEGHWELTLLDADGKEETLIAQAVISAVGQLNQPKYPDILDIDRFEGLAFHSARWPDNLDLSGKRVAVIGTGASAYQIVPAIASKVGALKVFQRNAPWMLPTPNYHEKIPDGMQKLFSEVPDYARWFRFWQFWVAAEGRMSFVRADPAWQSDRTVSEKNEFLREQLVAQLQEQFSDRHDLLAKAIPSYPPGAKRMLRDNGVWAKALKRNNVELITEGIVGATERGIVSADGREHEVDIVVYATGFLASDFLNTVIVTGRDGTRLDERWKGDAKAYLGITVPNFPNLFCLYGPNTNLVVNGSILFMAECAIEYTMECLRIVLEKDAKALECHETACQLFNDEIDVANRRMAWGASSVTSWYKNAKGRVSQNWPHSLLRYWQMTRTPDLCHYAFL